MRARHCWHYTEVQPTGKRRRPLPGSSCCPHVVHHYRPQRYPSRLVERTARAGQSSEHADASSRRVVPSVVEASRSDQFDCEWHEPFARTTHLAPLSDRATLGAPILRHLATRPSRPPPVRPRPAKIPRALTAAVIRPYSPSALTGTATHHTEQKVARGVPFSI